jgi:dTDP-4-amino-4,6-dideoxygalactose transaminase
VAETRVPLLDVKALYATIREPVLKAVEAVLAGGQWILGPAVRDLEERLARYLEVPHAVGVASGTDALLLALRALDCGPGAEVICPTYSFFATAGAIVNNGARPVFVDIEEKTFNLDPRAVARALTPRTRAVMPVHLFGQSAHMGAILDLCRPRDIPVIEDAAQAIGATWRDTPVGGVGDLGCFSFYPSKNLGGVGDGGLVTARRDDLAARVKMLRVHGAREKYKHEVVGFNSRLDSLQAAVLGVKLDHLDAWSAARAAHARAYNEAFAGLDGLATPIDAGHGKHVWNQYTLRIRRGSRDGLRSRLAEQGIGSDIYYPIPLHLQECFADLGYREGSLPVAEAVAREAVSIPVYPEMTSDQQGYVIETIRAWVKTQ